MVIRGRGESGESMGSDLPTMDYDLYAETTISYDYDAEEVVVYTTRSDVYEGFLALFTQPKTHRSLDPGYELTYRLSDCRFPAGLIR